jgi:superfamily II DNA or RNA helicase
MKDHFLTYFDSWTLEKGHDYFRRGKVLYQVLKPGGSIEGIVLGSNDRRYTVILKLTDRTQEINKSSCTCPVGPRCKHCAAVAFDFLDDAKTDNLHKSFNLLPNDMPNSSPAGRTGLSATAVAGVNTGSGKANSADDVWSSQRLGDVKDSYIRIAESLRRAGMLTNSVDAARQIKPNACVIYLLSDKANNPVPLIEVRKVALKPDDTFGLETQMKFERLTDSPAPKYLDEQDQKIGKLWSTIAVSSMRSSYGSYALDAEPELFTLFVSNIIASNRAYLISKDTNPLKLGKPLDGKLAWSLGDDGQRLNVVAVDEDADAEYTCLRWRTPWYLNAREGTCGPVMIDIPPLILSSILLAPPIAVSDAPAVQMFFSQNGLDRVIPEPLSDKKIEKRFVSPVHTLAIETMKTRAQAFVDGESFSEPGSELRVLRVATNLRELAPAPVVLEDGTVIIEEYDQQPVQVSPLLGTMGFREISASSFGKDHNEARYFVPTMTNSWVEFAIDHVYRLREAGWKIPADIDDQFRFIDFDSSDLIVDIDNDSDDSWWFNMSLTLDYEGQKFSLLPLLVRAIQSLPRTHNIDAPAIELLNHNGRFVAELPYGRFLSIPFERIRSILLAVGEMVTKEGKPEKLKVSLLDAQSLLDSELLINARWLGGDRLRKMAECLQQLTNIKKVPPPKLFNATLRSYQLEGLSWLQVLAANNFGGILADDMGLGKTVQLLAHICLEKENNRLKKPFLVICPTSVLPNWVSEAKKFCPHLKVVPYSGQQRTLRWPEVPTADVVISTYALVLRDIDTLKSIEWHGVILDESQAIKNPASQISRILGILRANHRFCVTGTPIENHLGELWSQFRFLLPGLLSTQDMFNRFFRKPIEQLGDESRRTLLTNRIRPFMMRRTKNEVAAELPEKTTIIESVELEGGQRDLYETVRLASTKAVRIELGKNGIRQNQILILDALLKLRQVCCDPRLVKLEDARNVKESSKLEFLTDKLLQLVEEGRRVLVFSQFTSMLDLIADELDKNRVPLVQLRGDTIDRTTPIEKFQNGEVPVFLISLKAGGTGLNLTAADTVIHYDPWWNPAVEEQATDRAHRIGQTKNVFVYKLIAQGTIEQRMIELQDRKRNLANSILDETGSQKMNFSEQDLEFLLAPIE